MNYSTVHKQFLIDQSGLEQTVANLKFAMAQARKLAKAPLGRRKRDGTLQELDHIERAILNAARGIGIDFGVEWGHQLDLTDMS